VFWRVQQRPQHDFLFLRRRRFVDDNQFDLLFKAGFGLAFDVIDLAQMIIFDRLFDRRIVDGISIEGNLVLIFE